MSARVGWLVQQLEEENSSLQLELKTIRDERDLLQDEVEEQRRLLKSCVEEVFALKEELSRLLSTYCPPAEAQRQHRLCERLARHVTDIEREVAEKGERAAQWRAEKESSQAALAELQAALDRQRQEARRLEAELQRARGQADTQAKESCRKIAELEETVDSLTKEKAQVEANHAKEVEKLKNGMKEAEESLKTASASQHQLLLGRREQERLSRQLATLRQRLAERDGQLADSGRQLAERAAQLAAARRAVEVKAAQVVGLKSSLQDSKSQVSQLQKELTQKTKNEEMQSTAITKKDSIIQRQKTKLEEVAKDLNKLKSIFSDQDLPGLCECNEAAVGGSLRDLRALRGGRPPPTCAARQLRAAVADLKKQLAAAHDRTRQLETNLDEIRQKLPHMTAESDRAYIELQTRLKESQLAMAQLQTQQHDQQKRHQQLLVKLAAESRRLRDSEQLVLRLRQENRSLLTSRVEWERTSSKLQSALHETVQLTARLQAARAELDAERKLTTQMRQRLDQADAQMKSQLNSVIQELHQLQQSSGTPVDWPRKYEVLLDRCQQWQEECLARQKDCRNMEQRLGAYARQDNTAVEKVAGWPPPAAEEEQLVRLEAHLQQLQRAFGRLAAPGQPARARSAPAMPLPVPSPRTAGSEAADTSSGSLRTLDGPAARSEQRPASVAGGSQTSVVPTPGRPPSGAGQAAPLSSARTAGSTPLPDLAPLMGRVAELVTEMERQRDQLSAQGRLLEAYRQQAERWTRSAELSAQAAAAPDGEDGDEEEPCRDGDGAGPRREVAGGDDALAPASSSAQDAQTQSAAAIPAPAAAAAADEPARRRHRSLSRRREREQLERLSHFRALQELLNQMASPADGPAGCPVPEAAGADLSELRAQWRRLETMVRDEAESARTRSDVVLRLSGISESTQ